MTTTNLNLIQGDLMDSGEPVIVQQLNCLCCKGHGLSQAIARRFPYSDVYSKRTPAAGRNNVAIPADRDMPGTISISEPPESTETNQPIKKQPIVVGLFGQYDYGKPGFSPRTSMSQDNYKLRKEWFKMCLDKLRKFLEESEIKSVGFPYQIGCGLAGGNWTEYQQMLEEFAQDAPFKVNIYQLAGFKCE